jgi:hypothetical protein
VAPDLASLRTKYERLLALRELHSRAKSDLDFEEPDPRAEMKRLSLAWPGCLRELDELPIEVIRTRIAALDRALRDASRIERWMIAQHAFHRLARGALAAKRWLGKRKRITASVLAEFEAHAPREARAWSDSLADIAQPPRGRLMDLVYSRVARELDTSVADARRLVR